MPGKNAFYAQSGGPTAVINASAAACCKLHANIRTRSTSSMLGATASLAP